SWPDAMIADTAAPAWPVPGNPASIVTTASGLRVNRTVTSVAMPSVPSEPTNTPIRSYPGGSSDLPPPSATTSPSGVTTVSAVTWWDVKPYLRQWAPPEFSTTLPPTENTCWL